MKQIDFKQNISVPHRDIIGAFEISVFSSSTSPNSVKIQLISGGTINSFVPTNLINSGGTLQSFEVSKSSKWFLCIDGTFNSNMEIRDISLSIKTKQPPPIGVTPYKPPTSFSFVIYTGVGSSYIRTIGPSPVLRPILMYREYVEDFFSSPTNYKNYYTLTFI